MERQQHLLEIRQKKKGPCRDFEIPEKKTDSTKPKRLLVGVPTEEELGKGTAKRGTRTVIQKEPKIRLIPQKNHELKRSGGPGETAQGKGAQKIF